MIPTNKKENSDIIFSADFDGESLDGIFISRHCLGNPLCYFDVKQEYQLRKIGN